MSVEKTYAGLFEVAYHANLFELVPEATESDRRRRERKNFPTVQSVAPYINGTIPPKELLAQVECHDLSTGGMAYFAVEPPCYDRLIVALATPSQVIYLTAAVAHCKQVGNAESPQYLIGCRFLGRVQL